jgi:hypothetical protein
MRPVPTVEDEMEETCGRRFGETKTRRSFPISWGEAMHSYPGGRAALEKSASAQILAVGKCAEADEMR